MGKIPLGSLAVLACVLLTSCQRDGNGDWRDDRVPFLTMEKISGSPIGSVRKPFRMSAFGYTTDKLAQYRTGLQNKTIMAWDKGHGTQVEFLSADGRTYLWYPGNDRIVQGSWSVEITRQYGYDKPSLCFRYGPLTYNPVTKQAGVEKSCRGVGEWTIYIAEMASGDPFRLSSGRVPFVLDSNTTTLDKLYSKRSGD